jgi:Spy/CpxP family protein refolding chaperone
MRKNINKILFIASVALNVVVAATYVTCKLPLFAGVHQPPAHKGPLFLQFDLAPDQLARFTVERDRFHAQLQELGQQIKAKQIELIDLLGVGPPDQRSIEKKQEEIQRLQGTVQDRVIVHFLQASSFLTPEQRARFFQLIKSRIEAGVQACPPWVSSLEQGRPGENNNE